jgi:hypothetical protein
MTTPRLIIRLACFEQFHQTIGAPAPLHTVERGEANHC